MKEFLTKLVLVPIILVTLISCNDDPELTGKLNLTFDNNSLNNQADLFVSAAILIDKTDVEPLIELDSKEISEGGTAEYNIDNLNLGNYYVRYSLFIGNSVYRENALKPIQITAGKTSTINIKI